MFKSIAIDFGSRNRRDTVQPSRFNRRGNQMNTLQALLGVELPIIQAPMAGVQGSALAVAVSNVGGLGSFPCAMLTADAMRDELRAIRAQTSKPFNVNFFCHFPPEPDPAREQHWRTTLAPYYDELGLDVNSVPS